MRILFVDDEPRVLSGLRRMLVDKRGVWDMAFVEGAAQALELLETRGFDVIVSDMRMPSMDGAELLALVRDRYPSMVRVILSGHSDHQMVMKSVKPAHQFLAKPCDPQKLEDVLTRVQGLSAFLQDDALATLVAHLDLLPVLPDHHRLLLAELDAEEPSLKRVSEIVEADIGLSGNALKLVNSSFFGLAQQVTRPAAAVGLLGLDVIRGLVVSTSVFTLFDSDQVADFSFEGLWRHCLNTGGLAKRIAQEEGCGKTICEESFVAGLLHDVGKFVLASTSSQAYNEVLRLVRMGEKHLWQAEKMLLGTTHAQVGAYLMQLWGMSPRVVAAITSHQEPDQIQAQGFSPLVAVHCANFFEHALRVLNPAYIRPHVDAPLLRRLSLEGRFKCWLNVSKELMANEEGDGASKG